MLKAQMSTFIKCTKMQDIDKEQRVIVGALNIFTLSRHFWGTMSTFCTQKEDLALGMFCVSLAIQN